MEMPFIIMIQKRQRAKEKIVFNIEQFKIKTKKRIKVKKIKQKKAKIII